MTISLPKTSIYLCAIVAILFCGMPGTSLTVTGVMAAQLDQSTSGISERIYREGILPSGKPLQAVIKNDISVPGTTFACASCHLRSGIGSNEGGVVTPPINGTRLYQALDASSKVYEKKYFPVSKLRPAYTDITLATAIRDGIDPAGRVLNPVMPRYRLNDDEMSYLVAYLKSLSARFSAGVTDESIKFATVISEDVPSADRDAMVIPLENYMSQKNNLASMYKTNQRAARMVDTMLASKELAFKKLSLSRWVLKGSPETWRSQLEEYYRKEPVFALLGGITPGSWKPIHDFSEANRVPCLFPQTNFPVISDNDWYTLYLSKGYYQEGESAARFLNAKGDFLKGGSVVQIVRDSPDGKALSTGFMETWQDLGHHALVTLNVKAGVPLSAEYIQEVLTHEKPAAVIIWDGPDSIPAVSYIAASAYKPGFVLLSGSYFGKNIWSLPDTVRDMTMITYPYRLPQDDAKFNNHLVPYMRGLQLQDDTRPIANRTYPVIQLLTQALMDMRGNYYRDNFFDVISMMPDQVTPAYERLSFGPGQRYASKGCYIVQVGKGPKPELVRMSEWVIR
jgi:ABC-type branched-subunit amino acid transport system substrate-binding protein